jgi:carbamoylphosphate synthase large subunit
MDKPTILLTSAGSLVGKVVLDALEGRREGVRLIACDASPSGANLLRCDGAHQVPLTARLGWSDALLKVVRTEQPSVIIPGRDDDVEELVLLAESHPELAGVLMAGSPELARVISDKSLTAAFARRHQLPYSPTVATGLASSKHDAAELVARAGFPLIAKPSKGSGSLGVRVLTSAAHVDAALDLPDYVIQPFHDPPGPIRMDDAAGLPMFWEVPEDRLYAVQYAIGRSGRILGRCAHRSRMVRGRCEELWAIDDPGQLKAADAFAAAAIAAGWRGPFNVQAKRDGSGWKVIELNGRFSGGTSCRLHLGFDEVALLVNEWLGHAAIPESRVQKVSHVVRQLCDFPIRRV